MRYAHTEQAPLDTQVSLLIGEVLCAFQEHLHRVLTRSILCSSADLRVALGSFIAEQEEQLLRPGIAVEEVLLRHLFLAQTVKEVTSAPLSLEITPWLGSISQADHLLWAYGPEGSQAKRYLLPLEDELPQAAFRARLADVFFYGETVKDVAQEVRGLTLR